MDEELRAYLESSAEAKVRGMTPGRVEAARVAVGSMEAVKDHTAVSAGRRGQEPGAT